LGKESALGAGGGGGVERVGLIKSLIYARWKECALRLRVAKFS